MRKERSIPYSSSFYHTPNYRWAAKSWAKYSPQDDDDQNKSFSYIHGYFDYLLGIDQIMYTASDQEYYDMGWLDADGDILIYLEHEAKS